MAVGTSAAFTDAGRRDAAGNLAALCFSDQPINDHGDAQTSDSSRYLPDCPHQKNSVRSTHIHISAEKMPKYLAEFCFRSNHRRFANGMFDVLLARV